MRPDTKARADGAEERHEQMIELFEEGMTLDEIARVFGITLDRVRHQIQRSLEYRERKNAKDAE